MKGEFYDGTNRINYWTTGDATYNSHFAKGGDQEQGSDQEQFLTIHNSTPELDIYLYYCSSLL